MKTIHLKNSTSRLRTAIKTIGAFVSLAIFTLQAAMAQDGNAGINQATSQVKSYFDTGTNLMYAIGAIVGLVGAIKVFKKWIFAMIFQINMMILFRCLLIGLMLFKYLLNSDHIVKNNTTNFCEG